MQRNRFRAAIAAFSTALVLAACGGGGSTLPHTNPTTKPTATPTPQALPSPAAQSNSTAVSPSASAATTATLPATGGIAASITLPKLTSGSGNVTVTVATGADATMSRARAAFIRRGQAMPGGTYLLQMDFVPDHDMTLAAVPSFSLDVTKYVTSAGLSISQAAAYLQNQTLYAGIVDGAGDFNIVGPLTISSTSTALTVSYSGPAVALTLKANQHYTVGVHLGPITAPTSSPTPTPTPSATVSPTSSPTSTPTPTARPTPTPTPTATATPTPTPTPTATPTPTPSPTASPMTTTEIAISGMLGGAQSVASGPDGNVWVTGTFYNSNGQQVQGLARVTPSGSTTVFDSGITAAQAVTAGPEGSMWYIGNSSDVIGRLNPATGAVTEYSYPSGAGGGLDIVTGPDGELWFTTTQAVGKIDPVSGQVTILANVQNPAATPCNIASGSDGDVYVVGNFSGSGITGTGGILQITPGGTMTAYDYTDINSGSNATYPHGVTNGPNRDIWFNSFSFVADFGTTIARYGSGYNSGAQLTCIASGSDGNLWVTDQANDTLYRVSTSGTVSAFSSGITTGAMPVDIIAGPDLNLWFTEYGRSSIGRFNLH